MIGKLVEDQARAGELGMDGEQAGAGDGSSTVSAAVSAAAQAATCRSATVSTAAAGPGSPPSAGSRQQRGKTLQHAKTRVRTARCRCQRRAPSPEREMARYRHPGRRLTSPETSRVPRQGSFIHTDLIAAPSSPGAMPPLPAASRGFALMLERAAAFIPVMARRRESRLPPSVPMNHRAIAFPLWLFPRFSPITTYASKLWLILPPEAGRVLDLHPAMRVRPFSPRCLPATKKDRFSPHLLL